MNCGLTDSSLNTHNQIYIISKNYFFKHSVCAISMNYCSDVANNNPW